MIFQEQATTEHPGTGCSVDTSATADLDAVRRSIPDTLITKLDQWTQGMYVTRVPLVWSGPDAVDPLFDDSETEADDLIAEVEAAHDAALVDVAQDAPDGVFAHTVITTQTCDVVGTGTGARHPYVQVSPVVRLPDDLAPDKTTMIKTYGIPYLAPISHPPAPGLWVVDLRVSIPVSKTALAARTPKSAFGSERDTTHFARHVARKSERPALHDALSKTLPDSIAAWMKAQGKKDVAWWQKVEQLRLRITGDRLAPPAAALVVIAETPLEPDEETRWRQWQASFSKELLRDQGIVLEPVQFTSMDMPARLYVDTVWIRVPELKRLPPLL